MAHCDLHDYTFVCPGKREWPELVGVKGSVAKAVIMRENPRVDRVVIALFPDITPPDFCCNRVWVWVDALPDGNVLSVPLID